MRKLLNVFAVILLLQLTARAQNFPAKENNCFAQFKPDAINRHDVNAYLLGYLTRLVYVQYLNKDMNELFKPETSTTQQWVLQKVN